MCASRRAAITVRFLLFDFFVVSWISREGNLRVGGLVKPMVPQAPADLVSVRGWSHKDHSCGEAIARLGALVVLRL